MKTILTQDNKVTKRIEYAVYRGDDVSHVDWREAKKMVNNLKSFNPQFPDVTAIIRVTRYWQAEDIIDEEEQVLWEK